MNYKQAPLSVRTTLGEHGSRHRTLISRYDIISAIRKVYNVFL